MFKLFFTKSVMLIAVIAAWMSAAQEAQSKAPNIYLQNIEQEIRECIVYIILEEKITPGKPTLEQIQTRKKKKDLLITTGVLLAKRNGLSGKAFGTSVAVLLKKKATQIKANPAKVWFDMKAAYGSKCTKMANDPSAYLQNVHDNMKKYDKK